MSDRVKGVWVAFDKDIRDDDAEALIEALKMMKHVANVTASKVKGDDWIIENKIKVALREKFLALYEEIGR